MAFDDGRTSIARSWLIPREAQIMLSACNRRDFTKAALTGAAAVSMPAVARAGRVIGANDRVRIGCIGVGYRGVQVLFAFGAHKDAEIASLCDVYEPYLNGQFDKIHPQCRSEPSAARRGCIPSSPRWFNPVPSARSPWPGLA